MDWSLPIEVVCQQLLNGTDGALKGSNSYAPTSDANVLPRSRFGETYLGETYIVNTKVNNWHTQHNYSSQTLAVVFERLESNSDPTPVPLRQIVTSCIQIG